MAQIVTALKDILVHALPTFFLFIALHWYLKKVLFQPMARVLAERRARTAGALEGAEAAVAAAAAKLASYEQALYQARAEIYAEQERARRQLAAEQTAALEQAKAKTAAAVAEARAGIAAEAEAARSAMAAESEQLAEQIARAVLAGRN
jgi:F-type H+-transporting ATPase subunit b